MCQGLGAASAPVAFNAVALSRKLEAPEVRVVLDCRLGNAQAICRTCDLSKQYVAINAEYHT